MNFTFLEVCDKELLERVFAFRYKILLETYPEYIQVFKFPDAKEYDKYDNYSVHFAALDDDGKVCATVRLIHHSPIGYPTENSMTFDNSMFEREKLGEMSRIFVGAKYRNIQTTKKIIQAVKTFMYIKMMKLGIEYTYGSLEESFFRLLRIYKMNYEIVGKKQMYEHVGLRYPSILYTERLGIDNPEIVGLYRSNYEA
ncbi:MAG: GNAT family N-acyltransferase [Sulfurimonas sp.]|uniref:GNAT family N-acyltransferase n=1 Tax=Sulfurimonas sp. TaxID=2022749 RepID=UPI0028CF490D|nr:GNAT family N-acyltransferase [Sulfurimonas sp.]MDT8338729.1 GNAT family N-acyltransferase [Sulfurimonas sp.]